ncbi:MAG: exodeoxyribonuclease VII large subunit [Pseudomonadales bacterium]|nr:exodeoxyribonuclease VII large subunit [Pseudomonadales bacterium]
MSELNRVAKNALERGFSGVCVEGEICDLLQHRSGHWYFTLKDDNAQLRAAMFRGNNTRVTFKPANGQQVQLTGRLSIYEPRGSYQFIAERMLPAGLGKLQQAFEQLKKQLASEGLFDPQAKQALPTLPRQVAIITSPQGAAIRDMQSTFARRFPSIELLVLPVAVQGPTAAGEIATAIELANRLATQTGAGGAICPDAIIVGRGGGSLEDLWSFNEPEVAHAIFRSKLPVISAVGHETDFTIADFVADARAATPTAAAEMLSPEREAMLTTLAGQNMRMQRTMSATIALASGELAQLRARLKHPGDRLQQQAQRVDQLDLRLSSSLQQRLALERAALARTADALRHHSPAATIAAGQARLVEMYRRLGNAAAQCCKTQRLQSERLAAALHIVSPLATLQRGYAIVKDSSGNIVRSKDKAPAGSRISAQLRDGKLHCTVERTSASSLTGPLSSGK